MKPLQTLQVARKKWMAKSCFVVQKKKILERDHRFSSMVFLEMDLGSVDLREA